MLTDDLDVRIRAAGPEDIDRLCALDAAIFGTMAYPYFVLRQLFDAHRGCWLVASDENDRMCGYALGVPTFDRSAGWLLGLGVRPDCRGRGYGRVLALASLRLLKSVGVRRAHLTVDPVNSAAISLYEQVGFGLKVEQKDYLGPGEDRIIMTAYL